MFLVAIINLQVDDDLDVVGAAIERFAMFAATRRVISRSARPCRRRRAPRPRGRSAGVGVDRADDYVVRQDQRLGHIGGLSPLGPPPPPTPREADDPPAPTWADRVDDHRADPGALMINGRSRCRRSPGSGRSAPTSWTSRGLAPSVTRSRTWRYVEIVWNRRSSRRACRSGPGTGRSAPDAAPRTPGSHDRDQLPGLRHHGGRLEQHCLHAE